MLSQQCSWQAQTESVQQRAHLCEVHEMLEAGIQMGFFPEAADASEMCVVDVCIHSKQALEHGAHHIHKVWGEGNAILLREDPRVIHLQTPPLRLTSQLRKWLSTYAQLPHCVHTSQETAQMQNALHIAFLCHFH